MIHLSSAGGTVAPPPAWLNRQALDTQIARRRVRLAELEIAMIAACEAAVHGKHALPNAGFRREQRSRTARRRYLVAAMRLESDYGPRMRRLRREIAQLERLMTLSIAA
jgi:hypothetical protein